jgi:uncharacterized protein YecT (DUF1311 family)
VHDAKTEANNNNNNNNNNNGISANPHHTRRTNHRLNPLTGVGQRVIPHTRCIGHRTLQQRAWMLRREARCITTR